MVICILLLQIRMELKDGNNFKNITYQLNQRIIDN